VLVVVIVVVVTGGRVMGPSIGPRVVITEPLTAAFMVVVGVCVWVGGCVWVWVCVLCCAEAGGAASQVHLRLPGRPRHRQRALARRGKPAKTHTHTLTHTHTHTHTHVARMDEGRASGGQDSRR
jgi:hypothetical protein